MPRLTVDPAGTHLLADGVAFPLFVDTAWAAFADPGEDEWRMYLAHRRRQGFSAALVAATPIPHDRDERPTAREPFRPGDAAHLHDDYFATARRYTEIAHAEFGIRLLVVVLWNNFVPGTWGAALTPHAVLPAHHRRAYVARLAEALGDLEPIFVVGGDDHYTAPAANAAYLEAAADLRRLAPACLLTTHTAPNATLPDDLADALDLYLHQSGHNVENQELTWRQPAAYLARRPRKPLLASEPPYEQHGRVNGHGRWSRDDVRRASWTSLLAGATAGMGYGAHGVWMWHTPSGRFTAADTSLEPYPWPVALGFPGALDISLMARLFADHGLQRLEPAQDQLVDDAAGAIRFATGPGHTVVALYQPYARDVELTVDLSGHRLTAWDLAERAPLVPDARFADGRTRLRQLPTAADQVLLAERPS